LRKSLEGGRSCFVRARFRSAAEMSGDDQPGDESRGEKKKGKRKLANHLRQPRVLLALLTSRDADFSGTAPSTFRQSDSKNAISEVGRHALHVNRFRQRKRTLKTAVASFDAVILLAGHQTAGSIATNENAMFFGVDLDLIACKSRNFRQQHVVPGRLVQVDRGIPSRSVGADQLADLLVKCEQIAERVPSRKSHDRIVA
jgi:hypothetical protein